MDTSLLERLVFWHWWVLALVLMCIEAFLPAAFFIWCGIAAAIVGLIVLFVPAMSWELQLIAFSVLSVVAVYYGRAYLKKNKEAMASDQPHLNRRGEQYLGRVLTLDEAIVDGVGRIRIDDSSWRIEGPDMAAGSKVTVSGVNGATLIVDGREQS